VTQKRKKKKKKEKEKLVEEGRRGAEGARRESRSKAY